MTVGWFHLWRPSKLLAGLRRLAPPFLVRLYHWQLTMLAAFLYGFPGRALIVVGVTGTKGKSTVVTLLGKFFEQAGWRVGWTSSISIKIGDQELPNPYHMTMPGRFKLQRYLRQMVQAGCRLAVIEVTSEGLAQFRHAGLNFDGALLTNLAREHIEAHGSFAAYQKTKEILFRKTARAGRKIINGRRLPKRIIVNANDAAAPAFIKAGQGADEVIGFAAAGRPLTVKGKIKLALASEPRLSADGVSFKWKGFLISSPLVGRFNLFNLVAAATAASAFGVPPAIIQKAAAAFPGLPGRMEVIARRPFAVIVDLAHTPDSFAAALSTVSQVYLRRPGRMIVVFGAAGGGRDHWKRPVLGRVAARYADLIILTNEDPYQEDPERILSAIAAGVPADRFQQEKNLFLISDRQAAIEKAVALARTDDVVVLLGKGTEATMVLADGPVPWDERRRARAALDKKKRAAGASL